MPGRAESAAMSHRPLRGALRAFAEECSWQLAADTAEGAEVPFEVVAHGRRGAPLYCYRPLVGEFMAQRIGLLGRLPSYPRAAHAIGACGALDDYLASRGERAHGTPRERVDAALLAFLGRVFEDSTDFALVPERLESACRELEAILLDGRAETAVIVPWRGLAMDSPEVALADGLALVRGDAFAEDAPPEALWARGSGEPHVLAVLRWEVAPGDPSPLVHARVRLGRLRTALWLYDGARPSPGAMAWWRTGAGPWQPFVLGSAVRPVGGLRLAPAQEDELRAFCSLVGGRLPRRGELAWALGRWELGCERPVAQLALTDHLLALRALLEPEGAGSGRLGARLAALCALPADRPALAARVAQAIAAERSIIAGVAVDPGLDELGAELAGHLRALLRDVLCGHLEPDLPALADALAAEEAPVAAA
jgi:hypothetical protein